LASVKVAVHGDGGVRSTLNGSGFLFPGRRDRRLNAAGEIESEESFFSDPAEEQDFFDYFE
jgi:hypothetical protein